MSSEERKTLDYFIDKSGREVKVGDFIVYGHNLGRCAGLRFGKVLKIEKTAHPWRDDEDEWKIGVQGIDDDWNTDINDAKAARKGTLLFPERILGINNIIPEHYKELLSEV